jgi:hypothetical protein
MRLKFLSLHAGINLAIEAGTLKIIFSENYVSYIIEKRIKVVPQYAVEVLQGRGGIPPTHPFLRY